MPKKEAHLLQNITENISSTFFSLRKLLVPSHNKDEDDDHKAKIKLYILNKKSKKCIDVKDAITTDCAVIQQWFYDASNHKKWLLEPVDGNYWRMVSFCDLCLEVRGDRDVSQGKRGDISSQKWELNEMLGGVKITPKSNPELCLGVLEDNMDNGGTIAIREWDGDEESSTIWLLVVADSNCLRKKQINRC
jgi:hypothetical protein